MAKKIGRNDPCPCGSGKKFKKCCIGALKDLQSSGSPRYAAVMDSMTWLFENYEEETRESSHELYFSSVERPEIERMDELPKVLKELVWRNADEWLMARGNIDIDDEEEVSLVEVVCRPGGPLLDADQKAWLASLGEHPIRLYEVLESRPARLRLRPVDFGDGGSTEEIWTEHPLSTGDFEVGEMVGLRVVPNPDGGDGLTSPAVYVFPPKTNELLMEEIREQVDMVIKPEDRAWAVEEMVVEIWLEIVFSELPPAVETTVRPVGEDFDIEAWKEEMIAKGGQVIDLPDELIDPLPGKSGD